MIVLLLVAGSLYLSFVFSYLYLWVVSPEAWAPSGSAVLPGIGWPFLAALLAVGGSAAMWVCGRTLPEPGRASAASAALTGIAALLLIGAGAVEIYSHWQAGLRPTQSSYGAMVYMQGVLNGQLGLAILIMNGFAVARLLAGRLDRIRRVSFDNCMILFHYSVAQLLFGLLLIHGFPRVAS